MHQERIGVMISYISLVYNSDKDRHKTKEDGWLLLARVFCLLWHKVPVLAVERQWRAVPVNHDKGTRNHQYKLWKLNFSSKTYNKKFHFAFTSFRNIFVQICKRNRENRSCKTGDDNFGLQRPSID